MPIPLTDDLPLPVGAIIGAAVADFSRAKRNGQGWENEVYAFHRRDVYQAPSVVEILERAYRRALRRAADKEPGLMPKRSAQLIYRYPLAIREALMKVREQKKSAG